MKRPLVSIITPVLNGEKHIEETIKSVVNQTYTNIEYIIIDGCSTDTTISIINKYSQNISCFISEPDDGIYFAMNKGIGLSNGDIIGIINSDDYYALNAVELIVQNYLQSCGQLVFYGNMMIIDEHNNKKYFKSEHKTMLSRLSMSISHPTVFVTNNIYTEFGGFDTTIFYSSDLHFIIKLLTNGVCFKKVNQLIASFRIGGFTSQISIRKLTIVSNEYIKLHNNYKIGLLKIWARIILYWTRGIINIIGNAKQKISKL